MKILLTRHGETDWNVQRRIQGSTDIPLNETGRQQAYQLAETLKASGYDIGKIYTSRMKRAQETARIAAQLLGRECIIHKGLEEICFGLWEGLTWDEVEQQFPDEYNIWLQDRLTRQPSQGESYQNLLDRVLPAMHRLAAIDEDEILVVTHSAVIMSLQAWIHHTPFDEMVHRYRTGNTEIIEIDITDQTFLNCYK